MKDLKVTKRLFVVAAFALVAYAALLAVPCYRRLRNAKVGEAMPEFRLPELSSEPNGGDANSVDANSSDANDTDANGVDANSADANEGFFAYSNGRKRVLAVAFLSSAQRQSSQAAGDIENILKKLQGKTKELDFAVVVYGPQAESLFQSKEAKYRAYHVLSDNGYKLWGKLGVIAMPTVVVVGKDDKILWVKAGYGYDFAPALHGALNEALGFAAEGSSEEPTQVKALENTGVDARLKRHLQMAGILERKGRLGLAILEVVKAQQMDPNSISVALELGRLYCVEGRVEEAIDVMSKVTAERRDDKAKIALAMGCAKRLTDDLEGAEKLLLEATTLNPKSSRAFFELGKVYQAREENDKAMHAYHKALSLLFPEPHGKRPSQQR